MPEAFDSKIIISEYIADNFRIVGSDFAIAGFIGYAAKGPTTGKPVHITSLQQFIDTFGEPLDVSTNNRYLYYTVEQFFSNGGKDCYVLNVNNTLNEVDAYIGIDQGEDKSTGIAAFQYVEEVSIMTLPGITDPIILNALIQFCEQSKYCFAILDMPSNLTSIDEITAYRSQFHSANAAMYYPWIKMYDKVTNQNTFFPPSGAIAGIYARVDHTRGIHKAPANELITNCVALQHGLQENDFEKLNAMGVNVIRSFPSLGIRIWGAKTLSSTPDLKFINACRLNMYIQKTINQCMKWIIEEDDNCVLWEQSINSIKQFLHGLWKDGAFNASTPEEAFYVEIDHHKNSLEDVAQGKLHIEYGIALTHPKDFVVSQLHFQKKVQ